MAIAVGPPLERFGDPPKTYGPYRLFARIADGQRSTVYAGRISADHLNARGHGDDLWLAIRVLRADADPGEFESRLRKGGGLSIGMPSRKLMVEGRPTFSDPLIVGENLATLTSLKDETPMPLDVAVNIGLEIAEALRASHARPHGDLVPWHVLVGFNGRIHLRDPAGHADVPLDDRRMPYRPPEQLQGAPPTIRSDVFALGALLFELTTGTPLFAGRPAQERLADTEPPRPRDVAGDRYPLELQIVLRKMLRPTPTARFDNAHAAAQALRQVANHLGAVGPSTVAHWIRGVADDRWKRWQALLDAELSTEDVQTVGPWQDAEHKTQQTHLEPTRPLPQSLPRSLPRSEPPAVGDFDTDEGLTPSDLTRSDLTRSDLTRSDLTRSDLTPSDLTPSDLTPSDLTPVDITASDFTPLMPEWSLTDPPTDLDVTVTEPSDSSAATSLDEIEHFDSGPLPPVQPVVPPELIASEKTDKTDTVEVPWPKPQLAGEPTPPPTWGRADMETAFDASSWETHSVTTVHTGPAQDEWTKIRPDAPPTNDALSDTLDEPSAAAVLRAEDLQAVRGAFEFVSNHPDAGPLNDTRPTVPPPLVTEPPPLVPPAQALIETQVVRQRIQPSALPVLESESWDHGLSTGVEWASGVPQARGERFVSPANVNTRLSAKDLREPSLVVPIGDGEPTRPRATPWLFIAAGISTAIFLIAVVVTVIRLALPSMSAQPAPLSTPAAETGATTPTDDQTH